MSQNDKELILEPSPSKTSQRARRVAEIINAMIIERGYAISCLDAIEKKVISIEKKIDILVKKLG